MARTGLTIDEIHSRFDDEHLDHLFALSQHDRWGSEERHTARICATINNTQMNALRLQGNQNVDDNKYIEEDAYIPGRKRRIRQMTAKEIFRNLPG